MPITDCWGQRIRVLAFALLSFAYVAWAFTPELGGFGGDNAIYLLSADYLSPFSPRSALSESYFASSQYPPVFPLVLGLTGAQDNLLVAHLAVTFFLLAALFVLYKWQRLLKISPWAAFTLTLLFALSPGTYLHTLEILSENLYLLLSLLGLFMYQRAESTGRQRWLFGAAIAIAIATLTRTAGVTLLAALLVHLLLSGRSRRNLIAAIVAITPVATWNLWRGGGGYAASLATTYSTHPLATFVDRLDLQAKALWYGWVDNFVAIPPLEIGIAISAFGVLCLGGLAVRLYMRRLDALYVAFYLSLMLIWPFPGESQRFVFVVLPVMMAQGIWLLSNLPHPAFIRSSLVLAPQVVVLAGLALVALPQLLLQLDRFATPLPAELSSFRHTAGWYHVDPSIAAYQIQHSAKIVTALKTAESFVPNNDCILSIKPSIVSYYTKRQSKSPPGSATPLPEFQRELAERGCSYLFLVAFSSPTFNQPFYPLDRLNGQVTVLAETRLAGPDSPVIAVLTKLRSPTAHANHN